MNKQIIIRPVKPDEAIDAANIEAICFPPNEACILPIMKKRAEKAPEMFFVAIDEQSNQKVGFITAIATGDDHLKDEYYTDPSFYKTIGKNMMILSLAVLPEYRNQRIATRLMENLIQSCLGKGIQKAILTCIPANVALYKKMGYEDAGVSASNWGQELWHEMYRMIEE